jgi:hypothetical protein
VDCYITGSGYEMQEKRIKKGLGFEKKNGSLAA